MACWQPRRSSRRARLPDPGAQGGGLRLPAQRGHAPGDHLLRRLANTVTPVQGPPVEPLTPREYEVLRLVAEGKTNGEIAYDLSISLSTVKFHIEHIIAKLGTSDRTQAAVR